MDSRIEALEEQIFLLRMKDNWSHEDYFRMGQMRAELRELKEAATHE